MGEEDRPAPAPPAIGAAGAVPTVLGAAGAVLLTGGAWAVVLRPGSPVALGVAVTGMGLVVVAWLQLVRTPVAPARAVRVLLAWGAPLLVAPPLFSRDVYSYLAQGMVALGGADPHRVGPAAGLPAGSPVLARVDGYWRETPSPYGPVTDLWQRAVAAVAGDGVVAGVAAYRLLAVVAVAGMAWAVVRLARAHGVPPGTALVRGGSRTRWCSGTSSAACTTTGRCSRWCSWGSPPRSAGRGRRSSPAPRSSRWGRW
ncbi:polyprenol phosphomannose-dependent alpha 1,6 mannosyltransferase MptB [Pseudonocardia sp. ICBG1293]|uniref:polyprenol phosphomannose-dependent alpha 1,6 mannosyltransferase MptB n=1 Tax=Pseudonocardia sp. ICBG1293 TaxID=2844382 RepID=UPI0027DF7140|nr:polyprenol phosphomannose-dependent alpha 1,6 mannosyltransferase MptB [Pseudonocardia sp. ICBG1293]